MNRSVLFGIWIPFLGTTLGSLMVFLISGKRNPMIERMLSGFASGVMVAASIWSLLLPAMNQSNSLGRWAFLPAVVGFWLGILFLLFLDETIPHLHLDESKEGPSRSWSKTTMMIMAVTIHNIPEGMAVGVVFAGYVQGNAYISLAGAMSLAIGIAIQNFPEGAIISMPLYASGVQKSRAAILGMLSGIVEPIASLITIWTTSYVVQWMPYLLSFASGAMMYVVVEELIPEMSQGRHTNLTTLAFSFGFTLMMALDVALG